MSTIDFATLPISAPAVRLAILLDDLGRRRGEVCHSTATLADRLRASMRSVRAWMAELVSAGLIERVVDYNLRTRRRLRLTWRKDASMTANISRQWRQNSAVTNVPPLHPPIEVSGDEYKTREAAGVDVNAEARPEGPGSPPPPGGDDDRSEETRETETSGRAATPEEVQGLRDLARRADPNDACYPAWCMAQAKRWGLSWVHAGLSRVVERRRGGGVSNPRGLLVKILRDFQAEGGPPRELTMEEKRAALREADAKACAEWIARQEAKFGPFEDQA